MKKIHLLILVLSIVVVFLFVAISVKTTDYGEVIDNAAMVCIADEQTIHLALWKDETEEGYYLFLPSWYADREKTLTLKYEDWNGILKLDGIALYSGSVWTDDGTEKLHTLEVCDRSGRSRITTTLQVLVSEKLPTMFVTVEDRKDLLKFEEFDNKKYIEVGSAIMVDAQGNFLWKEELSKFKVRGNLTATLEKKPFTFSFSEPREVLGMKPALKWNLIANATDGSYIRNKIIRDLASDSVDTFEPKGEFTELYLNGEYQGLYLLTEAVEVAENRIEIDLDNYWFVEMDLDFRVGDDEPAITTRQGQIFCVYSETGIAKDELAQVEYHLNDVESALYAEDGISQISGKSLIQLMDLESFADAWLIEELSGDHDIGISSQFAYAQKGEDALWYSGPSWDFDGIMGNVNTPMYSIPEALTSTVWMSRPENNNNQNRWLAAMWNHPEFRDIVKKKYRTAFRNNYENELNHKIDEYLNVIRRSTVLDSLRWHKERMSWWFVFPEGIYVPDEGNYRRFDTLDAHVNMIRNFMSRKLAFLDKLWVEECDFCVVEVRNPAAFLNQDYNQTLYYWVEKGMPLEGLPNYEHPDFVFEGYYDVKTGALVQNGSIIEHDCVLEGVWNRRAGE